jgi:uncharacterized protein YecT (DUF1311 family)
MHSKLDCRQLVDFEWRGENGKPFVVIDCLIRKTESRSQNLIMRYPVTTGSDQ